jgi:hypothetical protein
MQKVVAIFLKTWFPKSEHLKTEELLSKFLEDGWHVANAIAIGGASDGQGVGFG